MQGYPPRVWVAKIKPTGRPGSVAPVESTWLLACRLPAVAWVAQSAQSVRRVRILDSCRYEVTPAVGPMVDVG